MVQATYLKFIVLKSEVFK